MGSMSWEKMEEELVPVLHGRERLFCYFSLRRPSRRGTWAGPGAGP